MRVLAGGCSPTNSIDHPFALAWFAPYSLRSSFCFLPRLPSGNSSLARILWYLIALIGLIMALLSSRWFAKAG